MPILRRPYHAGSLLGPAPAQVLNDQKRAEWLARISGYWDRSNARAAKVSRALLSYLGQSGELMPSLETIARTAGVCVKTVQRWVEAFVEVGFLRVIRRRSIFGQTSNGYLIRFPDDEPAPVPEQLSFYSAEEESDRESSMDSLSAGDHITGRPNALRRLNQFLGTVVESVRPAPQPPRMTPEQQIALMLLQDRLALE